MLVTFSVANFRSFDSEETFSLVASGRLAGSHDDHLCPIPNSDRKVLRAGVVYGANGAGKSNLFRALKFVQNAVVEPPGRDTGTDRRPFRMNPESAPESSFDVQFISAKRLFRFGFKASDEAITEEWLTEITGNREHTLYERKTEADGRVIVDAPGLETDSKQAYTLASLGGQKNRTFLATIISTLQRSEFGGKLASVIEWFEHSLKLITPHSRFSKLAVYLDEHPEFAQFAGEFLRSASTGVDSLDVHKLELTEEQMKTLLPKSLELMGDSEDEFDVGEDFQIVRTKTSEKPYKVVTVRSLHRGKDSKQVQFQLSDESDGTIRLLHLLPAVHDLDGEEIVYFIDEIDRSLHPNLIISFFEFFLKACQKSAAQMIVTTHESNLLDLDVLRRDEIWFAEKDRNSATRLYALTDFKVRKDDSIRKHYLQGRYGAVPFLGDLNRLMAQENCD